MRPLPCLVLALLLAAVGVRAAGDGPVGPQLDAVTPAEGTRGTELGLEGSGFGAGKPRVRLLPVGGGKARKAKVLAWTDGSATARVGKVQVGVHDVELRPKGKGATPVVAEAAFEVRPPSDLALSATCASPGDELVLTGRFLGPKKGRVFVGGKRAKVLEWTPGEAGGDDTVRLRLPKKKVIGTVDVEVRTKVGAGVLEDALLVLDGQEQRFDADFGGTAFAGDPTAASAFAEVVDGETHVFVPAPDGDSVELRLRYDPATDGPATVDGLDVLQFTWQHEGVLWVLEVDELLQSSVTLTVDPHCSGSLLGTVEGYLVERFGGGTVAVAGGVFQVPLSAP